MRTKSSSGSLKALGSPLRPRASEARAKAVGRPAKPSPRPFAPRRLCWRLDDHTARDAAILVLFGVWVALCGFVKASSAQQGYAGFVAAFTASVTLTAECGGLGGEHCDIDEEAAVTRLAMWRIQMTLVGIVAVLLSSLLVFPMHTRARSVKVTPAHSEPPFREGPSAPTPRLPTRAELPPFRVRRPTLLYQRLGHSLGKLRDLYAHTHVEHGAGPL